MSKWLQPGRAVGVLLLLALVGVALIGERPLAPEVIASALLNTECHLEGADCATTLPGGGEVELSISPKPVKAAEPMRLRVTVRGREVDSVDVDFVGLNMNMGFNRPHLDKTSAGVFSGDAILPVCTRRRMDWEARVLLETPKGVIMAPFRFSTSH